jgi:hypothetical protein
MEIFNFFQLNVFEIFNYVTNNYKINYVESHSSHISLLPTKKTVKIVGIILDEDLKWNSHVDYLTKKGASLLLSFSHLNRFDIPTHTPFVYPNYVEFLLNMHVQLGIRG